MEIVVLDDDDINNFICENLVKHDFPQIKVSTFISATQAVEYLAEKGKEIVLLILDLNMPVMDGWKVLDEVLQTCPSLSVLVLTSSMHEEDKSRTLAYKNVIGYAQKPATVDMFRPFIYEAIKNNRQGS